MSLEIPTKTDKRVSLEEFQELFRQGRYDARDAESLVESSELLLSLSNNKDFLSDFILDELTNGIKGQMDNYYGPHVIKLGRPTDYTVMRANIWASEKDEDYRRAPNSFIYGVPHDHNFNFLTVGYLGPGYKSRYYEYDYDSVEGYTGEEVNLREVSFKSLNPDTVMLYRAHHDIHSQYAPESMSISLNVMDSSPEYHFKDQYMFNSAADRISVVMSSRCSPDLFEVAASFGDPEIQEALIHISRHHESDYAKACALRSALRAEKDEIQLEKLIAYGVNSGVAGVRQAVTRHMES